MTEHEGRDPDDPLRRFEQPGDPPIDDPFAIDDPAAREREQRRREREERRRNRQQRGKERRRALGRRVRGVTGGDQPESGQPGSEPQDEPPPRREPPRDPEPEPQRFEPEPQRFEPRRGPEPATAPVPAEREPAAAEPIPRPAGGAVWRRRVLALVALGVAAALVWFGLALFQPFAAEGEGEIEVEILEGETADEIANLLAEKEVISNASLFGIRLTLAGKGDEIAAGTYTLAKNMSYGAAIDALSKAPGTNQITVTIPEGYTLDQIAKLASDSGLEGDYHKAASKPPKGFDPSKYGAGGAGSLEGFLFPATYELEPGSSSQDLVGQQLAAFERSIRQVDMKYAESKNLDVYDVVTIASMIDREVQVPEERELVSAVIYNRLGSGEPLGIDATLRYALENYDEQLTQSDLATDTPYNTRLVAGLPPTPIGNPGLDSLEAAANPAKVDFRFYVVKPGSCGEHVFTASEQEFEQAVADYQAALEEQGGSPTEC